MEAAKQLDYQKKVYNHPQYRNIQVLPLTGIQTQLLSTAGGQENIFEIPVNAVNLSRSYLQFQASIGAMVVGGANSYSATYTDCIPFFQQVQLYTRSGVYLCDLNYVNNYTKIVLNAETKLDNFLTNSPLVTANVALGNAAATPGILGTGPTFYRNNAGTSAGTPRPRGAANGSSIMYTEPAYLLFSDAVNNISTYNIKMNLGMIKNTIFELDKDLYLGEIVILRIVWAPTTKIYYATTYAGNDPSAGASSAGTGAGPEAMNIASLSLVLAIEKNQEIVNQLRAQAASGGLSFLIPYTYGFKTALNGGSQSVSLRFNRGHGMKLKKVYHSVFNNTENAETAYDHVNINGSKVTSYYSLLNNERLQEFNLVPSNLDDWNYIQDSVKNSVLQDSNQYQYCWFHRDIFDGDYVLGHDHSNYLSGLDLNIEQKWDIYLTCVAANYYHYSFGITEKMLTVGPGGITVL